MLSRKRVICASKWIKQSVVSPRASLATEELEMELQTKSFAEKIFHAAVKSVLPQQLVRKTVKVDCDRLIIGHKWYELKRNVHLVGFGKAVLGMAAAVEKILTNHLRSGILCVPQNTMDTFRKKPEFQLRDNSVIEIFEGAGDNVPDEKAVQGANAVIDKIKSLSPSDILIVLISGGGSALLPKPREGITLDEKIQAIKLLTFEGASIKELNTVRKKLSEVKGGGLALLSYPVTTISLILSDVVNDPLDIIASGPTIPNQDKPVEAFNVLKKYNLLNKVPEKVVEMAKRENVTNCFPLCQKGFFHVDNFIIGNNMLALEEARKCAENLGFRTVLLSNKIDSLVHLICDFYVSLSFEVCKALHTNNLVQFAKNISTLLKTCQYSLNGTLLHDLLECLKLKGYSNGICIIAGGETTVKVKGSGTGGRNQELALLVSQKLHKLKQTNASYFREFDIMFLSAGTDGIDGNSIAAGAIGCADLIDRAINNFIDPVMFLSNNDSHNFFRIADKGTHLIVTGHTGTNVMDVHVLLIRDITSKSNYN